MWLNRRGIERIRGVSNLRIIPMDKINLNDIITYVNSLLKEYVILKWK